MDEKQKAALKQLVVDEFMSFPNGSAYHRETLPSGVYNDVGGFYAIRIARQYKNCWVVKFWETMECEEETVNVSFAMESAGGGVDYGAHYCTRDQVISALV